MNRLLPLIAFLVVMTGSPALAQTVFQDVQIESSLKIGTESNLITSPATGGGGFGNSNSPFNFNSNMVVDGGLWIRQTSFNQPAMQIRGGYRTAPRLQIYGLDADSLAWMGLGDDMSGMNYELSVYFPNTPWSSGRLTIGDYNGSVYNTHVTVLQSGNVGIGTSSPSVALDVNGDAKVGGDATIDGNVTLTRRQGDIWMGSFGRTEDAGPSN